MPRNRDQAIVLRRWEWSETSQTVALLTREHGLIRGLAKGARRERGAFSGGFEPLTRGELMWIERPSTELALLTEWELREVFQAPRRNLRAHHASLYMAEVSLRVIGDSDPHPGLWCALLRSLCALEGADAVETAALRFQWAALAETGGQPDLGDESEAGASQSGSSPMVFDPSAGRVLAPEDAARRADHQGVWRIRAETVRLLRAVHAGHAAWRAPVDPDKAHHNQSSIDTLPAGQSISRGALTRANRFLAACLVWTLEGEPPVSLDVFLGGPIDIIRKLSRANGGSPRERGRAGPAGLSRGR